MMRLAILPRQSEAHIDDEFSVFECGVTVSDITLFQATVVQ